MITLRATFTSLAAFAVAVIGCGGSTASTSAAPYVVNPGADVSLIPSSVDVQRFAYICGVMNPPYTDQDIFSLDIAGKDTPTPPLGAIFLDCSRNVKVGEPIVLTVGAYQMNPPSGPGEAPSAQQSATLPSDSSLSVGFEWGSNPDEVDRHPLDAATVTVLAFPAKDGDPLTVRFQFHFTDNRKLDETFSGPLYTGFSGCPAG
jgi:hypothetical protein